MMSTTGSRAQFARTLALSVAAMLAAGLLGAVPASAAPADELPSDGVAIPYEVASGVPVVDAPSGHGMALDAGIPLSIAIGTDAHSALVRVSVYESPTALQLSVAGAAVLSAAEGNSSSTTALVPVREGEFALLSSATVAARIEVLATFSGTIADPGATVALDAAVARPAEHLALDAASPITIGLTGLGGVPVDGVRAVHTTLAVDADAPAVITLDGQLLPVPAGSTTISTIVTPSAAGDVNLSSDIPVRAHLDVRGYVVEAAENATTANGPGSFWPLASEAADSYTVTDEDATAISMPDLTDADRVIALVSAEPATELTLLEAGDAYRGRSRGAAVDPVRGAQPQLAILPMDDPRLTLRRGSTHAQVQLLGTLLSDAPEPGSKSAISVDSPAADPQNLETPFLEFSGTADTGTAAPLRIEVRRDGEPHGIASLMPGDDNLRWSFRSPVQASGQYEYEFTLVGRDGSLTVASWSSSVSVPGADAPYILHPDAVPLGHPGHDAPVLGFDGEIAKFQGDPNLKPGQVIVAASTADAPEGFLRRVVAIDTDGNEWAVTTVPATFGEVFLQANYNEYQPMFDQTPPEITVTETDDTGFSPTEVRLAPIEEIDLTPYPDVAAPVSQDDDYYDIVGSGSAALPSGSGSGGGIGGGFAFSRGSVPTRMPVPPDPTFEETEGGKPIPPKGTEIALGGEPALGLDKTFSLNPKGKEGLFSYDLKLKATFAFSISLQLKLVVIYRWIDKPGFDPGYPEITVKNVVVALKRMQKVDVSGSMELTGKYEMPLAGPKVNLAFKDVTFMIGPVPVVITASLNLSTPIVISASASFKGSVSAGIQTEARNGFEYVDSAYKEINEATFTYKAPAIGKGSLLSGQAKAEIGPKLSAALKLYGAGGPELSAGASAGFAATASLNPDPKAKLSLYVTGKIELEVVFDVPIIDYRVGAYTLVDAKFTHDLWAVAYEYEDIFDTNPDGTPSKPEPEPEPEPDPDVINALEWVRSIYTTQDFDEEIVTGAAWVEGPPSANAVGKLSGVGHGLEGDDWYPTLSTGTIDLDAADGIGHGKTSSRGDAVFDVTSIRVDYSSEVPLCTSLYYGMLSEESRTEQSGEGDVFLIELDQSSWRQDGDGVTAPDSLINFVDLDEVPIAEFVDPSVVAGAPDWATDTRFADRSLEWVTTDTPMPAGDHSFYITIADLGDDQLDSVVAFGHLEFRGVSEWGCTKQTQIAH